MKDIARFAGVLVLFSSILAACTTSSPASSDPEALNPAIAQVDATVTKSLTFTPTVTVTTTPLPSPTPTPTPTPQPSIFAAENLNLVQVIRSRYIDGSEGIRIYRRAVSPDSTMVAVWGCYLGKENNSTCAEPYLAILEMDSANERFNLEPLATIAEVMQFSPDGRVLAIAGCHTPIYYYGEPGTTCTNPRVWLVDTNTGMIIHELKEFSSPARSLVFSPDGKQLYTSVFYFKKRSYTDSSIRVWDVSNGKKSGENHPDIVNCTEVFLDITPDGRYLITRYNQACAGGSQVKWWDLVNPSQRAVAGFTGVRFALSPDSSKIAVLESYDNLVIHVYELQSGKRLIAIPTGLKRSSNIRFAFTPDGLSLLVTNFKGTNDNGFTIVDAANGAILETLRSEGSSLEPLSPFGFSPDGKLLFTSGYKDWEESPDYASAISAWDTATWTEIPLPAYRRLLLPSAVFLTVSPDQERLILWDNYGGAAQLGFPDAEQESARAFLVDYLDLLAKGNYSEAAERLELDEYYSTSDWLQGMLPGIDINDKSAILDALCHSDTFPCLPLLKVNDQAQLLQDTYQFAVQFANPDGTPVMWPPCAAAPQGSYCDWRTDFDYTVIRKPDGNFAILNTLPFAVYLDQ